MRDRKGFWWWLFTLLCLGAATHVRGADDFPNKPVRIVVAYAPGGGNDLFARVLGKRLTETLGKTVLVDNRPGANGIIGTRLVANATPDGYTVILADMAHATNPFVYSTAQYDPIKDFAPITMLGSAPIILIVHPSVPMQSLADFIAAAKSQPGKIVMGSGGTGSTSHIAGEFFQLRTGTKLTHVPYKGTGPALADLVGGQIQCIFSPVAAAIPLVTAGRVRALAISSAKRATIVPDVPTFEETGVADFRVGGWYGILAPAGTPRPVVLRLNKEIVAAVQAPEVKSRFDDALVTPGTGTPEEFTAFLKAEAARWSQLIKTVGIKAD
jgi:tripartite-type tricarboxylate transporter receptor subunit TctC